MKTKQLLRNGLLSITVLMFMIVSGCKKDKIDNSKPDTTSLQQLAKDEVNVEAASDEALSDANDYLSSNSSKQLSSFPCNATIDSTNVVNDTITYTVTFNGLNCNGNRLRQGTALIKKHINTHWANANAAVTVTLINFKVTRVATGKWVIINGTKTFKNVSGGLVSHLGNGTVTSVVHEITGSIAVTFEDNTTRTWQVARRRTFTGTPGQLVVAHEGFGTSNGYSGLVTWGVNRHGENFYTQIIQAVTFKQTCGWDPCSGIRKHSIPSDNKEATLTFGYDDNDQPISSSDCPTRYKLDWAKNNNSGTVYLPL